MARARARPRLRTDHLSEADLARRRMRRFVYAVFAIIVLVALGSRIGDLRGPPRPGSKEVAKKGTWRITNIPTNYRASYLVETHAPDRAPIVNTEKVWVRRPFQSRIETWTGKPPGKQRLDYRQSIFGTLTSVSPRAAPLNVAISPSLATGDLRIDIALRDAVRRHVVVVRERRRVYGRECQVYRAGGPITAGDLVAYSSKGDTYTDICVERHGIVLEEWWISKGKLLRRRAATSLHLGGALSSSLFRIDVPEGDPAQRGAITRVPEDATASLWTLPAAPEGFRSLGRYVVARPTSSSNAFGGDSLPTVSTTDAFVRGPDLVVIDQNAALARAAAAEGRASFPVKVKGFEDVQLILDGRSNEIRMKTPDGSFVRVLGTLSPKRLVDIASQLKLVES